MYPSGFSVRKIKDGYVLCAIDEAFAGRDPVGETCYYTVKMRSYLWYIRYALYLMIMILQRIALFCMTRYKVYGTIDAIEAQLRTTDSIGITNCSPFYVMSGTDMTSAKKMITTLRNYAEVVPEQYVAAIGQILGIPVDGKMVKMAAYSINGNNYVKLRDVAAAMNGSEKQFNVTWNEEKKAIGMISQKAYKAVGKELLATLQTAKHVTASENKASIYLDNKKVALKAYNIGGNTYFKLRDLGKTLDFNVGWDAETKTVTLNTSKGYDM